MNFTEQLSAMTFLIAFFLGVTFGVIGGAVYGSLREDREKTLLRAAPDLVGDGARTILGVCTCGDRHTVRLLAGGGQVPTYGRDKRKSDGAGTREKSPER